MSLDEKPTVELEQPPKWAIGFLEKMNAGFASVNARLAGIETTVDTLVEDKQVSNQRMARIEVRMDKFEERADQNSYRVKGESAVNLQQDAAIATALEKLDTLAAKTDAQTVLLNKAGTVLKDPRVIAALVVIYTILSKWAEKHGYL